MTLTRRTFLFLLGSSAVEMTLGACQSKTNLAKPEQPSPMAETKTTQNPIAFELPPLPYEYNALEPYIDAQTMQLHHDKHHTAYVNNLNAAVAKYPQLQGQTVEALLQNLNSVPEDIRKTVRNNGGGHVNHTMFWQIMKPLGGGEPSGEIANAIQNTFGSFAEFQQEFNDIATKHFGSGWVWLIRTQEGNIKIITTPNQDSPLIEGNHPIMGNDLWEHAYYLKYQNRRADYLKAWWNVVNWDEINNRFKQANS